MQLTKLWATMLDDYAIDLAWSPRGDRLAAASAAGPVSVFRLDGSLAATLPGNDGGTNCIAFHPDASLLASGGQDGAVRIWDFENGRCAATAELGRAWVDHLGWTPRRTGEAKENAPKLAAAAGRQLLFLDAAGATLHACDPAPKTLTGLAWQPAGGCVAVAYFGGVRLWDADDYIVQKELPYNNGIHALVWSPDNRWLVSGNQDPSVHLWIPEEDMEFHMSGYETKVKHLSFDHTSRFLATSGGREACIWDCAGAGPEGRDPTMLPHASPVCAVSYQNSHSLLATASSDGMVGLWSPERSQPLRARAQIPHAATRLAWSPDDRHLAIGTEKGAIYILKCEA